MERGVEKRAHLIRGRIGLTKTEVLTMKER